MSRKCVLIFTFLPMLVVCPQTYAEDGLYFGLQGGIITNDDDGFDDVTNLGLAIGYEFLDLWAADFAIEGAYTTTTDAGDAPGGGDWEVEAVGLFGALRSAGPVYVIAKAGVLRQRLDAGAASHEESGLAAGLGLGFSLALAQFELQYVRLDANLNFFAF